MATNYPSNIDHLINPSGTDQLSAPSHSEQHSNANDAIEALQTKVGTDNSQDPSSLTYKISSIETLLGDLDNNTDTISELLGLDGNNDLVINGIENITAIDSFSAAAFRSAKYQLQITKGSEYYFSNITIIQDGSDVFMSESDIVSNSDNNLATVNFEINQGIISLMVTPVIGSVTARYVRTALKN